VRSEKRDHNTAGAFIPRRSIFSATIAGRRAFHGNGRIRENSAEQGLAGELSKS
jgi:hypothetical protein